MILNPLQEGIRRFPYFWKLHVMLGQLEERLGAAAALLELPAKS